MRIKETKIGFSGEINVGRYCMFIILDKQGVQVTEEELTEKAGTFAYVIIESIDEVFEQKEDIAKLIKKLKKSNNDIIIEIRTKATIKPVGISDFKNLIFNVHLQLKNTGVEYNKRIVMNAMQYFAVNNGYFIFEVNNEDDIDEVNLLISNFEIKKHQVHLLSKNLDLIYEKGLQYGYNMLPQLR